MKGYYSISRTLNNSTRKGSSRPNSAAKRQYQSIKIDASIDTPPPVIFTMPNNHKKLSGMGNKIEREQLYENNMQLKDIINKLKKELAETRNQVVKKDLEIRKKEKIIKECSKENDLESVHELNLEKARESTLVSLCRDKYYELKKEHKKKCEENEILKANIKLTKLKEYQIQIDTLKKEMEKLRVLYLQTLEDNKILASAKNEYIELKNKYLVQHNIINELMQKCNQYNHDISELKEENNYLRLNLEKNMKQKRQLKKDNFKLQISNTKFLNQKKNKDNIALNENDSKKIINKLRKEMNEYKRLYELRDFEFKKLKDNNDKLTSEDRKRKRELESMKPFNFNDIKFIETRKENKDTNKLSLYKSLLEESRHKNEIYELYLKKNGVDKDKLIKDFGYEGVISSNTKISQKEENNNNINSQNIDNKNISNNVVTESNNNNNLVSTDTNIIINEDNNLVKSENNGEINKEESIHNINSINSINTNLNSVNNNNINNINNLAEVNSINSNTNTASTNKKMLSSIEEEKQEEAPYCEDENQLLSLLHVYVKNLEANDITKEQINQKIEEICKLFENKEEASKEEFIEPFIKMFIDTMKITQDKDIEVITNFLSDFVDSLNGETSLFFTGLMEVFDNIKDYKGINRDNEVSFELSKYKDQLLEILKKYDTNNNHLITFDIYRKIVQELKIVLDDECMEYLIYKMKKNVPGNSSIFDLNYEIIEKLLEKNEIGNIFMNIKNALINKSTDIDNECQEFLNSIDIQDMKFLIIKKENFFAVLDKLNISISEELKNSIYEIFKIEIEDERNEPQFYMEYDRIKKELE